MTAFHYTTHLSLILEKSEETPVIIFKYSSTCNSSEKLKKELEERINDRKIAYPVFLVTVQEENVLSRKIADWFSVKHESPQIFLINKGKIMYTDHHSTIDLKKIS